MSRRSFINLELIYYIYQLNSSRTSSMYIRGLAEVIRRRYTAATRCAKSRRPPLPVNSISDCSVRSRVLANVVLSFATKPHIVGTNTLCFVSLLWPFSIGYTIFSLNSLWLWIAFHLTPSYESFLQFQLSSGLYNISHLNSIFTMCCTKLFPLYILYRFKSFCWVIRSSSSFPKPFHAV